jgi:hypothetical protein
VAVLVAVGTGQDARSLRDDRRLAVDMTEERFQTEKRAASMAGFVAMMLGWRWI